jgi:hypothetical protein
MAFATEADVEAVLGRSLTSAESNVVDNLLERATDRIIGHGVPFNVDDFRGAVKRVCAEMVQAVFDKPATTTSDYDASGYNVAREAAAVRLGVESATTSGPWLTSTQKLALSPYRIAMRSVAMTSEEAGS